MTFYTHWSEIWKCPDRRPIYEWAADHVELLPPLSKVGKFDVSISRHFIGPLDALWDDNVRQVAICAPTRGGKTLTVELFIHSVAARRPGPCLWSFQEEKAADDEASFRLWPQLRANKLISPLLPVGHVAKNKTIQTPRWLIQIVGPADSNFQSRGYQNVILDEVWLYKRGKIEEARGRLGDFVKLGTDKLVLLSQGGETDSDWDIEFNKGLIHDWHVQCMKCGHYMPPRYRAFRPDGSRWGFVFDNHKNERGLFIESKVIPTVRFECEKCGHPHIWSARTKGEWNRTGKYVPEANSEKREIRKSFRWNALIDSPWDYECALYIGALNALKSGNPIPLIKFLQKSGAEMASERSVLEGGQIFSRVDTKADDWEFRDERLMAIDKQEEHYWVEARDFSRRLSGESRRVWFGKCYSYEELEAKREEFKISPERVFVDAGYKSKGAGGVYSACARYGWTACKGVGTVTGERRATFTHSLRAADKIVRIQKSYSEPQAGDPETGTSGQGQNLCRLIRFDSDAIADRLDQLIENDLYKEPIVDESNPLEIERRKHFASEFKKKKVDKFSGQETWIRVCPSGNNHSYDLGKMLTLGAILTDVIPDPYDEQPKV